jgi:hypothetical protein
MVPKDMNNAPLRRRSRIIRKRRQTFQRLLFAAGAMLLLGLLPQLRVLLLVHLALDAALVIYVVQLRRWAIDERARARRSPAPTAPAAADSTVVALEIPEIDDAFDTIELPESDFAVSR